MDEMRLQFWAGVKWALALAVAQLTDLPFSFRTLGLLMLLDMTTGVVLYFNRRELSSGRFGLGVAKKFGVLVLVGLAHPLENLLTMEIGVPLEIGLERWIAVTYCFGEAISIVENVHGLGVPIPAILVRALLKAKKFIEWSNTAQVKALKEQEAEQAQPPKP